MRRDTLILWFLAGTLLLALAGSLVSCTRPPARIKPTPAPPYQIESAILRTMNAQILAASVFAMHESEAHARVSMDEWRERVRLRTEDVFIPWYSDYWTQQWIAARVAWYKLQYTEGEVTPEERLVGYLQEQFYTQVLKPVSDFIDPNDVMNDTTGIYLLELKYRLDPLPPAYGIPVDAFKRHLDSIPAIVVPPREASLDAVLQTGDLYGLPAYAALLKQLDSGDDTPGPQPSQDRLYAVARSAVTRLVESLAVRGGAAAASTIVNGVWGGLISLGAGVWGVLEHDQEKPLIEAQLRENLDAALEVMWQELVEDQQGGVAAVVHHINQNIENALTPPPRQTRPPPVRNPDVLF